MSESQTSSTTSVVAPEIVVHKFHALEDPRWAEFLQSHPNASIFHSPAWLRALRETYGYEPTVITTCPPGVELTNGLVVCKVKSWLTGSRLVAVPFADHCEPLIDEAENGAALFCAIERHFRQEKLPYIEFRPKRELRYQTSLFRSNKAYCFHQIDLTPDLDTLFKNCHKDSTQRKIRRAAREGLVYEEGRSESLLDSFYQLFVVTRRRHMAPPPPKKWFRCLINCFGEDLKIRIASKDNRPVAGILTLRYKDTLLYKYGGSDARFNNLGGTHFLFWNSIKEAKDQSLRVFDLGRSDIDNSGLITFKDRWGAARSELMYSRFTASAISKNRYQGGQEDWPAKVARRLVARVPSPAFALVGRMIYKHIG